MAALVVFTLLAVSHLIHPICDVHGNCPPQEHVPLKKEASDRAKGCNTIRTLFWPLSCIAFETDYFEQEWFITRNASLRDMPLTESFGGVMLNTANLRRITSKWKFKVRQDHAQVVMLKPDSFEHDSEFPEGSEVTMKDFDRAFAKGNTLVFHNVELYLPTIGALSRNLHQYFGLYSQANIYYSPPGMAKAVNPHQDAQSVFVLQMEGSKSWKIWRPLQPLRLKYMQRGKGGDKAPDSDLSDFVTEVVLSPNDVLFVPRSWLHATSTTLSQVPSLHITIGVETETDDWIWRSLIQDVVSGVNKTGDMEEAMNMAAFKDEDLRRSVPLSVIRDIQGGLTQDVMDDTLGLARQLIKRHKLDSASKLKGNKLEKEVKKQLKKRREFVEAKENQLLKFMDL